MKLPDKFITYKDSVLSKLPPILEKLENQNYTILSLFNSLKGVFNNDIHEFINALTCLYALNKIYYYDGVIIYVKND